MMLTFTLPDGATLYFYAPKCCNKEDRLNHNTLASLYEHRSEAMWNIFGFLNFLTSGLSLGNRLLNQG
jgi:hypothetical protein